MIPTTTLAGQSATTQLPAIKITGVRIHRLAADLQERFGWSLGWTKRRTAILVEVRTDAGLTGWGDGYYGGDVLFRHPELVLGRSPFEVEAIYDDLRSPAVRQGRPGPAYCGGLDVALWDVVGQALEMPVWRLLGKQYRDRVKPYCTALYRKDWNDLASGLAAEAAQWVASGFDVLKMKVGYEPNLDEKIVRAVRDAIGNDIGLAVDANCSYDSGTAIRLGSRLQPMGVLWFEEPVLAEDLEGYRRFKSSVSIPLAGGETLALDELVRDYVQPRLVDILQPEIENIGLTGARRLSYLCWLNRIRLIPHNWSTCVRTAAILHWMSTAPPVTESLQGRDAMFEFDQTENPLRDSIAESSLTLGTDGCIPVPAGPGLGVRVVSGVVEKYRQELLEVE